MNKLELAEKYLEAIGSADVFKVIIENSTRGLDETLDSEYKEKFLKVKNAITWDKVKGIVCEFTVEHTPTSVLLDAIDFYTSDSGKYLREMAPKQMPLLAEKLNGKIVEIAKEILGDDFCND